MVPDILAQAVSEALKKHAGVAFDFPPNIIEDPPEEAQGDAAYPVFALSRTLKKAPQQIAADIAQRLVRAGDARFARVEAVGGYVNFFFTPSFTQETLAKELKRAGEAYGTNTSCHGQRVMIEFSQPNTHKEFHVGHLRNVCIGDSLVRLYRASGCFAIAANYINDFGLHVAVCLWAMKKFHPGYMPPEEERGKWLGEVYAQGMRALEERPEHRADVDAILKQIEARAPEIMPLFLETRQWSLDRFKAIYRDLHVDFDTWFYESDIKDEGKEMVADLVERGIAVKSQGAIIVDLAAYGLDVLVILKSDGTGIYATSDLALAHEKFKKFEIDAALYVTDVRQSFYFKQLFKTLELAGFKKKLGHIGYEFVRLPEGAMSSRAGRVVLYEDFKEEVLGHATKETAARHPDWDGTHVQAVAETLTVGAMKFDLLKHDPSKVVVFSIADALSFDGFTAPYIQYTYARIRSIFRKNASESPHTAGFGDEPAMSALVDPAEKRLALKLLSFGGIVGEATATHDSAIIARYLYELARDFSGFYENCPVLPSVEPLRGARLSLCSAVAFVLKKGLFLLGIDTVDEM